MAKLLILDASSNELEAVPQELEGCAALSDLHLSSNHLIDLPDSIGASRRVSFPSPDSTRLVSCSVGWPTSSPMGNAECQVSGVECLLGQGPCQQSTRTALAALCRTHLPLPLPPLCRQTEQPDNTETGQQPTSGATRHHWRVRAFCSYSTAVLYFVESNSTLYL